MLERHTFLAAIALLEEASIKVVQMILPEKELCA
jgi:hypothetical protein